MRKLALIAVMLLLPAVAIGQENIINTGFEEFSLGNIAGQTDNLGNTWGSWDATPPIIIADPTASGHGQVVAFVVATATPYGGGGKTETYCDRLGFPPDVIYSVGLTTATMDVYLYGNGGDFTNFGSLEIGPNAKHYLDGGLLDPGDDLHAWTGGAQWDPPTMSSQNLSPIPVDTWFTLRMDFHTSNATVDYYVNGLLVGAGLPTYWVGSNGVNLRFDLLDPSMDGVNGMLIDNVQYAYIPEPSILLLAGLGLLPLMRRRKK